MATIKEIAELAGVSRGTVDRVLNNRGAVSEQTARKVLDIARALQYRPNRAGIVLAAQKRNLKIGVILFDNGNPFFDEVLSGVQKKARELEEYNCCVSVSRVGFDLNAQLSAMEEMAADGTSGIILTPTTIPPSAIRSTSWTPEAFLSSPPIRILKIPPDWPTWAATSTAPARPLPVSCT